MAPRTQDAPGYYVWEVPDQPIVVQFQLDVIDGMLADVMRGFGAVPKRGAEVGGVLLGSIEPGEQTIVRIDDFEAVDCTYKRGPSYLFTEEDGAVFHEVCERWQADISRPAYAVGYFRSHTRDGMSLSPDDIVLMNRYFAAPSYVALLIKPFATKASTAGFFFREDGVFQQESPLQFPFRRRDLAGEEAPPRRPLSERGQGRRSRALVSASLATEDGEIEQGAATELAPSGHAYAVTTPSRSRLGGWMWIPLSFVFLLLGVALGFQAATSMGLRARVSDAPDVSLGLKVGKAGDNLKVEWNPESPQIRSAQRGVLEIQDGTYSKPVDLDATLLQSGNIIYRNSSNDVHFRLSIYMNARLSVAETLDWRQ